MDMMTEKEVFNRLRHAKIRPSVPRIAIMEYLLCHHTHPTVDDVYQDLCKKVPTLSRTTVYNTLRRLSDNHAAQMITIDDHRVCYDGNIKDHVHFYCKKCGKITDLMEEPAPQLHADRMVDGNIIQEQQLYYKGVCAECAKQIN